MSIINQTLRELDARQAAAGGVPLPPPVVVRRREWRPVIAAIALVSAAALFGWFTFAVPGEATPRFTRAAVRSAAPQAEPQAAPQAAPRAAPLAAPRAAMPPAPTPRPAATARADLSPRLQSVAVTVADPAAPPGVQPSARHASDMADVANAVPRTQASIRKDFSPPSADAQAEASYRRAVAFAQGGRESEARALLQDTLRIAPGYVAARRLLATLLHEAGQYDAAEATLAAGLRASPDHAWFALSLARMQAERGDLAAAVATLGDGLERRTVDADYQATLAALLLRLDRHGDAARQYEQALASAPGNGRWWMGLGLAREGEGNAAAARAAYGRALVAGDLPEKLVDFVQAKLATQ